MLCRSYCILAMNFSYLAFAKGASKESHHKTKPESYSAEFLRLSTKGLSG